MKTKICENCGEEFKVRDKRVEGQPLPNVHRKYCDHCSLIATKIWSRRNKARHIFLQKRWIKENPGVMKKAWKRHRLIKYGLTELGLEKLLRKQKQRCAICKRLFGSGGRSLSIDHKHGTRQTHRGILCANCNHMIGNCREIISVLRAGIKYLIKWRK